MNRNFYDPNIRPQNYATPPSDGASAAYTSQMLGIIGIVTSLLCCCVPAIGLILGIVAVVEANRARRILGADISASSAGRVCGIVSIVLSALALAYIVFSAILTITGVLDQFARYYAPFM